MRFWRNYFESILIVSVEERKQDINITQVNLALRLLNVRREKIYEITAKLLADSGESLWHRIPSLILLLWPKEKIAYELTLVVSNTAKYIRIATNFCPNFGAITLLK